MTREAEIKAIFMADPEMRSILTGGVYTEQEVGVEGIRRGEGTPTENAFDERGQIKPTALIREGNVLPYGNVRIPKEKYTAISQVVSIFFFQMRGWEIVEAAKIRSYELLEGVRLDESYPIWWVFETPPVPDSGPILNSTTLRQDWMVVSWRKPN